MKTTQRTSTLERKKYTVSVQQAVIYSATIEVSATSQEAADKLALKRFGRQVWPEIIGIRGPHLPPPWRYRPTANFPPEVSTEYRCIDCQRDTDILGHGYMVHHPLWEATGLEFDAGFLCFDCLERRIGRELTDGDFISVGSEAWEQHKAKREVTP